MLVTYVANRIKLYEHIRAHDARHAIYPALRTGLAACGLFAVCGFAIVRRALPAGLRRHELLWVLPVGAAAAALELTVLGYAYVPFNWSLGLVIAVNALLAVAVLIRRSHPLLPARPALTAWPVYLAVLLAAFTLLPLYRAGFPTVIGDGSDAHLAAGTAQFLTHHHPTDVAVDQPVNQLPFVWRSKPPIYYALGATAHLAGLPTWEALSPLQAVLFAILLIGFYLLATELLGAPPLVGLAALVIVGLNRRLIYTAIHPFYNQMWGLLTMPATLVLAWRVVADWGQRRIRGTLLLLALFLAVGAFGYPLALPIPLLALAAFAAVAWWQRRRTGLERPTLRSVALRARHPWLIALAVAAVVALPVFGVIQKLGSGLQVVFDPTQSLAPWSGNQGVYFPVHQFLSVDTAATLWILAPLLLLGAVVTLRLRPLPVTVGLLAVFGLGAAGSAWFHARQFGEYFDFKLLSFVGPLVVLVAVTGIGLAGRRRGVIGHVAAAAAFGVLGVSAFRGAHDELGATTNQLPQTVQAVSRVAALVGPGRSVRLDMNPPGQLWVAYFLDAQPLCSQRPLLDGSYPHVSVSRRADFILADRRLDRPYDATGPVVAHVGEFTLYRESASVPGPDRCSRRRVQPFTDTGAV